MKSIFPIFFSYFQCNCTKQEALYKIEKAVESKHNSFKIINKCTSYDEKIILQTNTGSYMFFNSFMPIVTIDVNKQHLVSISFSLMKTTKAMIALLMSFALLFEALLIYFAITNQLSTLALLLLPAGFLCFILLLSFFGLLFSSKNILKNLFNVLNCDDTKNYPTIQTFKFFSNKNI